MIFDKIIQGYKQRYTISYDDLRDSNESNRITVLVISSILLLADIIDFFVILIFHHAHLN